MCFNLWKALIVLGAIAEQRANGTAEIKQRVNLG